MLSALMKLIWAKLMSSVERSSLKPASLLALSVQTRSMRLVDTAAAVRPEGAAGVGWVVADAVFE